MKKLCMLLAVLLAAALPACAEGEAAEYDFRGFTYALLPDGTAEIIYASADCSLPLVPSELDGHAVSAIGDYAFSGWDAMESLELPGSVRRVGDGAFADCAALRTLTLPDGDVEMGANPFMGCSAMESVEGGNGRYRVTDQALVDGATGRLVACLCAPEATAFTVPEGVTEIGDSAFAMHEGLTRIELPPSVTSIGEYAFTYCTALETLELPAGIREIPTEAFSGCVNLTEIALPEQLERIGEDAFMGCENLIRLKLPEGLVEIDSGAFSSCMSLELVSLPDSLTRLGVNPFMDCESLAGIAVSEDHPALTVKDGALFTDEGRRLVCYPRALKADTYTVPQGTEVIDDYAFYYCNGLVSVLLPDSVTEIGESSFEGRENLTLTVERGSAAEAYAVKNGLKYTYPGADAWLNG